MAVLRVLEGESLRKKVRTPHSLRTDLLRRIQMRTYSLTSLNLARHPEGLAHPSKPAPS
jgi:hypothetical protein